MKCMYVYLYNLVLTAFEVVIGILFADGWPL